MPTKFAVIVFPGSNCDHDAYHAAKHVLGQDAEFVWHKETDLRGADVVILPGGFSHGDYLRTGAIARFSPVMDAVRAFAAAGGPVLGICNGFQILLEAGLLPGAMLRNRGLKFRCEHVHVRVEQTDTPFTLACRPQQVLRMPDRARRRQLLHHAGGAAQARAEPADRVPLRRRVRRGDRRGEPERLASSRSPASATKRRNVVGLMPHPERACELALGSADGLVMFESVVRRHAHGTLTAAGSASA